MKLELYYFPSCPYCQLVLGAMDDLKIKDKIELKDIQKNNFYREFLIEKTGRKTVPCLFIDDTPMHESQDIVNWLHDNRSEMS